MKPIYVLALLMCCCGMTGCESLSDATTGVREKFAARNEPRTKTFSAQSRQVFEAVRAAGSQMGYRMTRGGAAQGEFEGIGGIGPGESAGSARQVGIKVKLHPTLDGTGTDVSVRFTEILESMGSHGRGIGTESTMRDTPLYEVFFRHVEQALGVKATERTPAGSAGVAPAQL